MVNDRSVKPGKHCRYCRPDYGHVYGGVGDTLLGPHGVPQGLDREPYRVVAEPARRPSFSGLVPSERSGLAGVGDGSPKARRGCVATTMQGLVRAAGNSRLSVRSKFARNPQPHLGEEVSAASVADEPPLPRSAPSPFASG